MKRMAEALLVFALVLSLAACGGAPAATSPPAAPPASGPAAPAGPASSAPVPPEPEPPAAPAPAELSSSGGCRMVFAEERYFLFEGWNGYLYAYAPDGTAPRLVAMGDFLSDLAHIGGEWLYFAQDYFMNRVMPSGADLQEIGGDTRMRTPKYDGDYIYCDVMGGTGVSRYDLEGEFVDEVQLEHIDYVLSFAVRGGVIFYFGEEEGGEGSALYSHDTATGGTTREYGGLVIGGDFAMYAVDDEYFYINTLDEGEEGSSATFKVVARATGGVRLSAGKSISNFTVMDGTVYYIENGGLYALVDGTADTLLAENVYDTITLSAANGWLLVYDTAEEADVLIDPLTGARVVLEQVGRG